MSVELQCISLIIPIKIIEKYYPGGFEQYKKDRNDNHWGIDYFSPEKKGFWYDDDLVIEGSMNYSDTSRQLERWEKLGVKIKDENNNWLNVCVMGMLDGPFSPCDWLVADSTKILPTYSLSKKFAIST